MALLERLAAPQEQQVHQALLRLGLAAAVVEVMPLAQVAQVVLVALLLEEALVEAVVNPLVALVVSVVAVKSGYGVCNGDL